MKNGLNKTVQISTEGNYLLTIMWKTLHVFNRDSYYRMDRMSPGDIFTYKIMHLSILYNRCFIDDEGNEYYILDHRILMPSQSWDKKENWSQDPIINNDSMIYYKVKKRRKHTAAVKKTTVDWYSFTFIFDKIRTAKFVPLYDKGEHYKNLR